MTATLVPSEEQIELARAVRDLLAKRASREHDPALWTTLRDLIEGAGPAELHLVLEELGYSFAPSPLLAAVIAAAALGSDDLDPTVLAWSGVTGPRDAEVTVTWDGSSLTGSVDRVPCVEAESLLVPALHDDGIGLFRVDPATVIVTSLTPLDPTTPIVRVELESAPADVVALDATEALDAAHRAGALAVAALQVGCIRRGLDMTVDYLKQREQFGRPIGSFQALKHRVADLLVLDRMARSGAWAAVQDGASDRLVAAATSYCSDAALTVAGEVVQLHGGIAITWEHDAHLVLKRAEVLNQLFGRAHTRRASLVS